MTDAEVLRPGIRGVPASTADFGAKRILGESRIGAPADPVSGWLASSVTWSRCERSANNPWFDSIGCCR